MGKPTVFRCAMPVLRFGGNEHHIARVKFPCFLAPLLIPTPAIGAEQDLSAAAFGVVDMPVIPASRLKGQARKMV